MKTEIVQDQALAPMASIPAAAANDRVPGRRGGVVPALDPGNDNAGPGLPAPSAPAAPALRPGEWSHAHPHVAALIDDIEVARENAATVDERKLAGYLAGAARSDGFLPAVFGRHSYRAICKAAGIGDLSLRLGTRLRKRYGDIIDRFMVDPSNTFHGIGVLTAQPDTLADRFRRYVADAIRENRPVPSDGQGRISRKGVGDEMGISITKMTRCPYFALIKEAIADGRLRLGPAHRPGAVMTPAQRRARFEALKAVYDGFDVPGGKVPESMARIGAVDWDYAASLTGTVEPTMQDYLPLRRHVSAIVARRGTALPGATSHDNSVAVVRLGLAQQVEREQRARGNASVVNVVANHRKAYDRLVAAAGLDPEDDAAPAFCDDFQRHRDAVLRDLANPRTAANVGRFLDRAREFYLARLGAAALPDELGASLTHLMDLNGVSCSALAREVDCERYLIRNWQTGISSVSTENMPVLARIERFFKLPTGTLSLKAKSTMGRMRKFGGGSDEWRALPSTVRSLLPPGASDWSARRLADAVGKVRPLISCGTQYGRLCSLARTSDRKLQPHSPGDRLQRQFDQFVEYKTAPITGELDRSFRGLWKTEGARDLRMETIGHFFRILSSPVTSGPNTGLGMDPGDETFAWLAHTPLVIAAIAQRARRFADMEWNGQARGTFVTATELGFAQIAASLTNPVTGFLTQQPHYAETLVPSDARLSAEFADVLPIIDRGAGSLLLSPEDVAFARRDWKGYCARNHRQLQQAIHVMRDDVEVSRSPMDSMDGLMRTAEPVAEFVALTLEAEERWADERIHPFAHRLDVRDSVMARLHPITGFRPENLSSLVYTGDRRGEIRKLDGVWEIEMSYKRFKNFSNCRLFGPASARQNYRLPLVDQAGLFALLDRFFFDVLPAMRSEASGAAAFLTKTGRPMTPQAYRNAFARFSAQHIAHNPVLDRGFPGVVSMTPYGIRHLRATDALKNGLSVNRVEEAAFSIQTSEDMIRRHYGFMIPETALLSSYETYGKAVERAMRRR